jgi:choline dehydrogenase-like flavoprotein
MVGMGWTGSIMARELTKAGLTVVGLERGVEKSPREDFALPRIRDELKYRVRQELMLDTSIETHTLRNDPSELHHTGGAIMGTDPKTSALNRYLQSWEASNLFVMGGAAFPQNPGHNPTCTIGALAYWSAQAITTQYLKSPGPLVKA